MPNTKALQKPASPKSMGLVGQSLVKSKSIKSKSYSATHYKIANLYRDDPGTRISVIRNGIPATMVGYLSATMGISKELLLASLGLSRATISRKEKDETALSKDESERVIGISSLIGQVETMVAESGNPTGFNAPHWVANWLVTPLPALAGATPASYMDTFEGQKLVSKLLSMNQSGAYA